MTRIRTEERFAEEVLRRVLGVEVTGRDNGSAPRMADVLFNMPDGSSGALEVTTIGERDALEREAIAAKKHWHVAGARWAWLIHVGDRVVMRDLERHLPSLVLTSERLGVPDPRLVPYEEQQVEAFRWFDKNAVSMCGIPESRRHGKIDVLPDGGGGAVFEHLDELPAWVSARLREPDLHENVEKLKATGRSELHLFLRIHDTAMPFSLYYPLAWGGCVPASALDAPAALTGLWLAPAWHNPILWWSTGRWVGPRRLPRLRAPVVASDGRGHGSRSRGWRAGVAPPSRPVIFPVGGPPATTSAVLTDA